MRVLIAWSNGGNWGHVSRQLALAGHAEQLGAEVVWAVPVRKADAMSAVRARGYRVLASRSVDPPLRNMAAKPRCYADILLSLGFGDTAALEAQVSAWMHVFAQVQPDRVLIDYAPAAQLAALLAGLPAVQVTNGFDSPPAECPPYEGQVRGPYLQQHAATQVQKVDRAMRAVASKLNVRTEIGMQSLIEYPQRLFDCVPESDPYAEQRALHTERITYVGPLGQAAVAGQPQWPAGSDDAPRVFAYLRGANPHFKSALEAFHWRGANLLCVWPDAPDDAPATLPSIHITRQPVQIQVALKQADAVLNYGSSTLVAQALLAGKPQLMLPADHEKFMVSAQVARGGFGRVCTDREPEVHVSLLAQGLLLDAAVATATRVVAAKYEHLRDRAAAAICEALCGAAHNSDMRLRSSPRIPWPVRPPG